MRFDPSLGIVAACFILAGTSLALAQDAAPTVDPKPAAEAQPSVAPTQVASLAGTTVAATVRATDPLHLDPNWPLFQNCIDNTATPAAFQGCLQLAFLGTGPSDKVVALLTR
jgi:hypothetical protein